jgi:hypothetical protein
MPACRRRSVVGLALLRTVEPERHFQEIVSVGADARSQFDALRPISVLQWTGIDEGPGAVARGDAWESAAHRGAQLPILAIVDFVGADAVLQGVERHTDVQIAPGLFAEGTIDYVRGTLSATGEPLPRMPPMRVLGSCDITTARSRLAARWLAPRDRLGCPPRRRPRGTAC